MIFWKTVGWVDVFMFNLTPSSGGFCSQFLWIFSHSLLWVDGVTKGSKRTDRVYIDTFFWKVETSTSFIGCCQVALLQHQHQRHYAQPVQQNCGVAFLLNSSLFCWYTYIYIYIYTYLQIITGPSVKNIAFVLTPLGFARSCFYMFFYDFAGSTLTMLLSLAIFKRQRLEIRPKGKFRLETLDVSDLQPHNKMNKSTWVMKYQVRIHFLYNMSISVSIGYTLNSSCLYIYIPPGESMIFHPRSF